MSPIGYRSSSGSARSAGERPARVGGGDLDLGQLQLAAHEVGAEVDRDALVERDAAREPLAAEPQSVESTRRSGGTYSSALRIKVATNSGGSTAAVEWFTTPMAIFLSVRWCLSSGRSRPFVDAHSSVSTSAFVANRYGSARS